MYRLLIQLIDNLLVEYLDSEEEKQLKRRIKSLIGLLLCHMLVILCIILYI